MTIAGVHNVQIVRGFTTSRCLLSSNGVAKVDLWSKDDDSNKQVWEFMPIIGTPYFNIRLLFASARRFLSCTSDGYLVDTYDKDDGSGRQRWIVEPVPNSPTPDTFLIRVSGGTTGTPPRVFLSCTADGTKVDLYPRDDGSGRQRWQLQEVWRA